MLPRYRQLVDMALGLVKVDTSAGKTILHNNQVDKPPCSLLLDQFSFKLLAACLTAKHPVPVGSWGPGLVMILSA